MIVHCLQIHPRDAWCAEFHIRTYLRFCDRIAVTVDSGSDEFCGWIRSLDERIAVVEFPRQANLSDERVNENGMFYCEASVRQAALELAMAFDPTLIVFGDADEVPTPGIVEWVKAIDLFPQSARRWYCHWVNLWGDYQHAIGGGSAWSFENFMGNKKCLAMQPGGNMTYFGDHHTGMEPGRGSGGPAPIGEGHWLVDNPKLLHLKYGSEIYKTRPESKLPRHQPQEMLRGGKVVDVPADWLWEGMPA